MTLLLWQLFKAPDIEQYRSIADSASASTIGEQAASQAAIRAG